MNNREGEDDESCDLCKTLYHATTIRQKRIVETETSFNPQLEKFPIVLNEGNDHVTFDQTNRTFEYLNTQIVQHLHSTEALFMLTPGTSVIFENLWITNAQPDINLFLLEGASFTCKNCKFDNCRSMSS